MNQKSRQEAIRELIKKREVEDQHSLVSLLKEDYGIDTNQTAVSRDLHRLGAVKVAIGNKMVYELPDADPIREILRRAIRKIEHNESLIVIHTLAGLAAFVGYQLDTCHDELDLMGTLAGENVVFVTPRSTRNISETYARVCEALYYKISS